MARKVRKSTAITPVEYSGLQAAYDYFNEALFSGALPTCRELPSRRACEKVEIPQQYSHPTAPLSVTPNQVIKAFISANDGLSPKGITIECGRGRLREVRI